MKVAPLSLAAHHPVPDPDAESRAAHLVLAFGSREALERTGLPQELRTRYPAALIFGCSTSGEILGTTVADDTLTLAAVTFRSITVRGAIVPLDSVNGCREAGARLGEALRAPGLSHLLVLSDGLAVNGTLLVEGIASAIPANVTVTGGLAGDAARFQKTLVMLDREVRSRAVAAVGFYGPGLRVGCGSLGGWDSFGPERRITRSDGSTLFELDGKPALDLYCEYLGPQAAGLPATGLLFPLSLKLPGSEQPVVRTLLSVNESDRSLTFAGDMPMGAYARLMSANFDRLVGGAIGAAESARISPTGVPAELAILISCVGRKLVLKQRIEEEVEGVRDVLGDGPTLVGFYSYGEISPFTPGSRCELHNQTMTITTLREE